MSKVTLSSQVLPIFLYLCAAFAGAFGQYFYKLGGLKIGLVPLYKNFPLFAGILLFCLVMVFFVAGFRLGGRMSIVYPVYATTFIWGTLIAIFLGKEPWSILQMMGIATIVIGVVLVALGGVE